MDTLDEGLPLGAVIGIICGAVFVVLPCLLICGIVSKNKYEMGNVRTIDPKNKDKRCVVNCLCGETAISFRNWSPRAKCECMCYDCKQRHEWQMSQGAKLEPYYEYWDLMEGRGEQYVDNAITEVKGRENLETWSLREGSKMRMLVCNKCKYVMVCSNVDYAGKIVITKSRTSECEKIPVSLRFY